jgi:hypothetical protein
MEFREDRLSLHLLSGIDIEVADKTGALQCHEAIKTVCPPWPSFRNVVRADGNTVLRSEPTPLAATDGKHGREMAAADNGYLIQNAAP